MSPVIVIYQAGACSQIANPFVGNWLGSTPIPDTSLEDHVNQLEGEDKELMFGFARSALRWLPEERPTAEEMAYDDWLMEALFASKAQ